MILLNFQESLNTSTIQIPAKPGIISLAQLRMEQAAQFEKLKDSSVPFDEAKKAYCRFEAIGRTLQELQRKSS